MSDRECQQYRFKIDVFSVESLPMSRLGEYMTQLAKLLGEEERVHFSHLEPGSAVLVATAEEVAAPKVAERINKVAEGTAPREAMSAFRLLDTMLAKDNAVGVLSTPDCAQIIPFPGRTRPKPVRYGPFKERGSLDGVVIRLGGKDETIPVLLQDGEVTISCQTSMEISKRLAAHYRAAPVRVYGDGKWVREEDGSWHLLDFYIHEFEALDDSALTDVVGRLRAVEGSKWGERPDAISDILGLRRDVGDQH
jgi:hypothetical protein